VTDIEKRIYIINLIIRVVTVVGLLTKPSCVPRRGHPLFHGGDDLFILTPSLSRYLISVPVFQVCLNVVYP
jgi:hypothetical protein